MGRTKKSSQLSPKEAAPAQNVGSLTKSRQTRNTKKTLVHVTAHTVATEEHQELTKPVKIDTSCCSSAKKVTVAKPSLRRKRKLAEEQTAESGPRTNKRQDDQLTMNTPNKKNRSVMPQKRNMRSGIYSSRGKVSGSSNVTIKQVNVPSAEKQGSYSGASAAPKVEGSDSDKPSPRSTNAKRKSEKDLSNSTCSAADSETAEQKERALNDEDSGSGHVRTGSGKLVGAHCSIAGGLHKAVEEAVSMGGRAFGLFLRSQRTWTTKPLDPEAAEKFKVACKKHGFSLKSILPHGSYLMNCGSPNPETLKKSRDALLEELMRCEALGITLYNFHPGSTCGEISVEECLDRIADSINWAHGETQFVTTVVENMSCQGNTVGGRFEELKGIIDRVKDKTRIGICLDTCHAFAAGFDLSSKEGFEKFVADFDKIVGFQYLRAMHLNDSKGGLGCHLDRHENIGKGHIGIEGFRRIMTEPRFDGIPMILETPLGNYAAEIRTLNKLT